MLAPQSTVQTGLVSRENVDRALAELLERLLQNLKSFSMGDRVSKEKWVIHFDSVRVLLGDPNAYKSRVEAMIKRTPRPKWLTQRHMLALNSFLQALKNPKQGIGLASDVE